MKRSKKTLYVHKSNSPSEIMSDQMLNLIERLRPIWSDKDIVTFIIYVAKKQKYLKAKGEKKLCI